MAHARYDEVAGFYAGGWQDVYDDPASVALLSLLGDVRGVRVLDVACGHGRYTREIARRGALSVVGIDISAGLIERAEAVERDHPLGVRYLRGDVTAQPLDAAAASSYDKALCGFGLSDIDDLDGALRAIERVLVPGGSFAFSILHPCFPGAGDVSGSWPPRGSYRDEGHWYADGAASTLRARVGANHRTLSTYLNALIGYGLTPDRFVEPHPDPDWAARHPAAASLPLYLVVACTKPLTP